MKQPFASLLLSAFAVSTSAHPLLRSSNQDRELQIVIGGSNGIDIGSDDSRPLVSVNTNGSSGNGTSVRIGNGGISINAPGTSVGVGRPPTRDLQISIGGQNINIPTPDLGGVGVTKNSTNTTGIYVGNGGISINAGGTSIGVGKKPSRDLGISIAGQDINLPPVNIPGRTDVGGVPVNANSTNTTGVYVGNGGVSVNAGGVSVGVGGNKGISIAGQDINLPPVNIPGRTDVGGVPVNANSTNTTGVYVGNGGVSVNAGGVSVGVGGNKGVIVAGPVNVYVPDNYVSNNVGGIRVDAPGVNVNIRMPGVYNRDLVDVGVGSLVNVNVPDGRGNVRVNAPAGVNVNVPKQ